MNCNTPHFGGNESWKKLFWIQFKSESICMCWKHKNKTGECHYLIIFVNIRWKCAALSWASIVANLFLLWNRILLMSPLQDLVLLIRWHLIKNNSTVWIFWTIDCMKNRLKRQKVWDANIEIISKYSLKFRAIFGNFEKA